MITHKSLIKLCVCANTVLRARKTFLGPQNPVLRAVQVAQQLFDCSSAEQCHLFAQ